MHIYDYSFLKKTVPGNFLQVLYKCYKDLDESFTDISLKKAKKSERVVPE